MKITIVCRAHGGGVDTLVIPAGDVYRWMATKSIAEIADKKGELYWEELDVADLYCTGEGDKHQFHLILELPGVPRQLYPLFRARGGRRPDDDHQ
jgi:hypothetical protein